MGSYKTPQPTSTRRDHHARWSRSDKLLLITATIAGGSYRTLRIPGNGPIVVGAAFLCLLGATMTFAAILISRALRTKLGEQITFSIAVGIAPAACGALTYGSASSRRAMPIGIGAVGKGCFTTLAGIAFTLTAALMIETRFVGSLPANLELQRRKVFRSFYIGGAVTTSCAIAGVCLARDGPAELMSEATNSVAALFGASLYGSTVIGLLLVVLAAVPREGFAVASAREDAHLQAQAKLPRRRTAPGRRYARSAVPAAVLSLGLLAGALFTWWIAIPAVFLGGVWLLYAWISRERFARADESLPLHPLTLIATILTGVALPFIAHGFVPSFEPADTQTARHLYDVAGFALGAGYVAFAAGHPPEPGSGLLPSLHTVGVWTGIAMLAAIGLASAALASSGNGGWFVFWATAVAVPAMLGQILLLRSAAVRPSQYPLSELREAA